MYESSRRDFSGLKLVFFPAVREGGGLGVVLYPGHHFKGSNGLAWFPPVTTEGQWMELWQAQKGPSIFVSPVLFHRTFLLERGFSDLDSYSPMAVLTTP